MSGWERVNPNSCSWWSSGLEEDLCPATSSEYEQLFFQSSSCRLQNEAVTCLFLSSGLQSAAVRLRRGFGVRPPGRGESGAESSSGPESDREQQPGGRQRGRARLPPRGNCSRAAGVLVPPLRRRPCRYGHERAHT